MHCLLDLPFTYPMTFLIPVGKVHRVLLSLIDNYVIRAGQCPSSWPGGATLLACTCPSSCIYLLPPDQRFSLLPGSRCGAAQPGGERSNPSDYRSIALTSTISKVFECFFNSYLFKHLMVFSLITIMVSIIVVGDYLLMIFFSM